MGTYSDEDPNAGVSQRLVNAVRKTVAGVARLTAPHSVTDLKARENEAEAEVHDPQTLARMHNAQTTDHNNSYNY